MISSVPPHVGRAGEGFTSLARMRGGGLSLYGDGAMLRRSSTRGASTVRRSSHP